MIKCFSLFFFPDTNDCVGVTCKNHGQCVDQVAGYKCNCADGYEGRHCEHSKTDYYDKKKNNNTAIKSTLNTFSFFSL